MHGVRHFLPAREEVDGLLDVWVPSRARGDTYGLYPTLAQTYYGAAVGAVYLHGEEIIPPHSYRPGGVELADDIALCFKNSIASVI
jgi:hypothetical protein